jgi:HSP20 family protein
MVTRFDPFRDLDAMASRLLDHASDLNQAMRAMPMDLFRSGDHYVLLCDLPGVDPGSIDVGVDGRVLTIRAQRSQRGDDVEWLTQERPTGAFVRQLTLGAGLDIEHIEAAYTDGVLSLTLPVAAEGPPRRIEVAHVSHSPAISGTTTASDRTPAGESGKAGDTADDTVTTTG